MEDKNYVALYKDGREEPIAIIKERSAKYLISLVNMATRGGFEECPSYHTEPLDDKSIHLVTDILDLDFVRKINS